MANGQGPDRLASLRRWAAQEKPSIGAEAAVEALGKPKKKPKTRLEQLREWQKVQEGIEQRSSMRERLETYAAGERALMGAADRPRPPKVERDESDDLSYGRGAWHSVVRELSPYVTSGPAGLIRSAKWLATEGLPKAGQAVLPLEREAWRQELQRVRSEQARARILGDDPSEIKPRRSQAQETVDAALRPLERPIKAMEDYGQYLQKKYAKSPSIRGKIFDPTNPRWLVENVPGALAQLGTQVAASMLVPGAGIPARIAMFAAPNMILEGGTSFREVYNLSLEQTGDPQKAEAAAAISAQVIGLTSSALEAVPGLALIAGRIPGAEKMFQSLLFSRLRARIPSELGQRAVAGGVRGFTAEGVTEAVQEASQAFIQYQATANPKALEDLAPRLAAAGFLGGVAGGVAGVALSPLELEGVAPRESDLDIAEAIAEATGIPVEEIAEAIQEEKKAVEPRAPDAPGLKGPGPFGGLFNPFESELAARRGRAGRKDFTDASDEEVLRDFRAKMRTRFMVENVGQYGERELAYSRRGQRRQNERALDNLIRELNRRGINPEVVNPWENIRPSEIRYQPNVDLYKQLPELTDQEIMDAYLDTLEELQGRENVPWDQINFERVDMLQNVAALRGMDMTVAALQARDLERMRESAGEAEGIDISDEEAARLAAEREGFIPPEIEPPPDLIGPGEPPAEAGVGRLAELAAEMEKVRGELAEAEAEEGAPVKTQGTRLTQTDISSWMENAAVLDARMEKKTTGPNYAAIEAHAEVLGQNPEWIDQASEEELVRLRELIQTTRVGAATQRYRDASLPRAGAVILERVNNRLDALQGRAGPAVSPKAQGLEALGGLAEEIAQVQRELQEAEAEEAGAPKRPQEAREGVTPTEEPRPPVEAREAAEERAEAPPAAGPVPAELLEGLKGLGKAIEDARRGILREQGREGPGEGRLGFPAPSERVQNLRKRLASLEAQVNAILDGAVEQYGEGALDQIFAAAPILKEVYRGAREEVVPGEVAPGPGAQPTEPVRDRGDVEGVEPERAEAVERGARGRTEPGAGGPAVVPEQEPEQREEAEPEPEEAVVPRLVRVRVEPREGETPARRREIEAANDSPVFVPVRLDHIPERSPHPRVVVESRSMAGMPAPTPATHLTSQWVLNAWEDARLSDEQVDTVFRGIEANETHHHGFVIADDVGVGKTREMLGFIFEAFERGKETALYTTKNYQNVVDVEGEIRTVLGIEKGNLPFDVVVIHSRRGIKKGPDVRLPRKKGRKTIYILDYYNWKDYADAVIELEPDLWVADEAHLWKNQAAGYAAQWIRLHNRMRGKNGWFMYGTATPAVSLTDLQYLYGLKLWQTPEIQDGEPVLDDTDNFTDWIRERTGQEASFTRNAFNQGISPAESEQVMRELKGSGHYMARDIWRGGVVLTTEYVKIAGRPESVTGERRPQIIVGHTRSGTMIERLKELGWGRIEIAAESERGTQFEDYGSVRLRPYDGEPWAIDSGIYAEMVKDPEKFTTNPNAETNREVFFQNWLWRAELIPHMKTGRPFMVVLPDIPFHSTLSLETSAKWLHRAPAGVNYYLPIQNGMTPEDVQHFLDTAVPRGKAVVGLFLGGDDTFKLNEGEAWAKFAHERRLKLHYARAGTKAKLDHAIAIGADSIDTALPLWEKGRFEQFADDWAGQPGPQATLLLDQQGNEDVQAPAALDAKDRYNRTVDVAVSIIELMREAQGKGLKRIVDGVPKRAYSGTQRSLLQSYLKQVLFEAKVPKVLEIADLALSQGRQVVISVHSVTGDPADADGSLPADIPMGRRIEASLEQIPTARVLPDGTFQIDYSIEAAVDDLRKAARELPRLKDPIELFTEHFGEGEVAAITGGTPGPTRVELVKEFQDGERRVAIISKAGKEGISLHDVNGNPRTHIVADYEWSADTFKQELGRSDRSGQQSAPELVLVASDFAAELKFVATIAARMSSLGATSKGAAESTGTDQALDEFDVNDPQSAAAARDVWEGLTRRQREMFQSGKFRDRRGNPVPRMPTNATSQFLTDLAFMHVDEANEIMRQWVERRDELQGTELEAKRRQMRTARLEGKVLETVPVVANEGTPEQGPHLTVTFVEGEDGKRRAVLHGFVTQHMKRIQEARRAGTGKKRPRKYVRFTEKASGGTIAGLAINTAEAKRIMQEFGVDPQTALLPPEAHMEVRKRILDGERVIIRGPGTDGKFETLELSMTRTKGIKVMPLRADGGAWATRDLVNLHRQEFAGYTDIYDWKGKTWITLTDTDDALRVMLQKFGLADQEASHIAPEDQLGYPDRLPASARLQLAPHPLIGMASLTDPAIAGPYMPPVNVKPPKFPVAAGDRVDAQDVIDAASKIADAAGKHVPIRVGHMGGAARKSKGFLKVKQLVIRIREARDIPTALHEVAHALEVVIYGYPKGSPWTGSITGVRKVQQNELMTLGRALYGPRTPTGGYKREGFAEFVRIYIQDEASAQRLAPAFFPWFETFLRDHPDVRAEIAATQEKYRQWDAQGALNRGREGIVDTDSYAWKVRQWREARIGSFVLEELWEQLAPLKKLVEYAEEQTGQELELEDNPFETAWFFQTRHVARAKVMRDEGMINLTGEIVGPSLQQILGQIDAREQEDFTVYLWAKRAWALITDPKGSRKPGMTKEDAQQIIDELQAQYGPRFDKAANELYQWQDGVLEYAAQASPTWARVVQQIRARDPGNYIPLQRIFEDVDAAWRKLAGTSRGPGGGRQARRSPTIGRLKGSMRRIRDPMKQILVNTQQIIQAAHERMVTDQLFRLSKVEGMGTFIEEVPRDVAVAAIRSVEDLLVEIQKRAAERGVDIDITAQDEQELSDLLAEMVTFFTRAQRPPGGKPIIPMWDGRTMRWFYVDPFLFNALRGLDAHSLQGTGAFFAFRALESHASLVRAGTTGARASFGLITNLERDPQTLWAQTQTSGTGVRLMVAWARMMREAFHYRRIGGGDLGELSPAFQYYIRWGGEMTTSLGQDRPTAKYAARRLFAQDWRFRLQPRNWISEVREFYTWYTDFIQFSENAPRAAEIQELARERGIDLSQPISISEMIELGNAATWVTTPFPAGGRLAKRINRMVPFFNVAFVGPRAALKAAQRNPQKYIARGLTVTAVSFAFWLMYHDEDWWKQLDHREKFLNWHFPIPLPGYGTVWVRVPRAFENGLIFAALPEAALDQFYNDDPEAAEAWLKLFFQSIAPPLLPPSAEEFIEQIQNEDSFSKIPIVSVGEQRQYPKTQYNEYTSRLAIWIGQHWPTRKDRFGIRPGVSPKRIDHAIRGLMGPVGGDLVELLGLGPADRPGYWEPAKIPVFGRQFMRNAPWGSRSVYTERLYEAVMEAERFQQSVGVLPVNEETGTHETPDQRERRLLLRDAANAVTAALYVRRLTDERELAVELTKEVNAIAKDALDRLGDEVPISDADRERFRAARRRFEAERQQEEGRRPSRRRPRTIGPPGGPGSAIPRPPGGPR